MLGIGCRSFLTGGGSVMKAHNRNSNERNTTLDFSRWAIWNSVSRDCPKLVASPIQDSRPALRSGCTTLSG
jgi:hypothetical protein